ncbi:MAG: hypothetical protein OHK0012_03400 [Synechococcales cyanobacterium]
MAFQVEPATAEAPMYVPYFSPQRRPLLPYAVGLFKKMGFEGQRTIEGETPLRFAVSWEGGPLPVDQVVCRVKFGNDPQQFYEMTLSNYELVEFLIDVVTEVQRGNPPGLSTNFFKRLMRREDITSAL